MIDKQFIEVDRVLSNKITKENVSVERECVDISLIKTFRGWHKGDKDKMIKGDMTILILKPDEKPADQSEQVDELKRPHSMIIEESYSKFRDRISRKVIIRKIDDAD